MVPDVGFVLCSECSTNGQDAWFCATCCRTAILVQHNVGAWAVLGAVLRLFFPPADTDGVDFRVAGVHIDGVHVRLKPGAFIKEVCTTPIICVSYVIRCFPKGDCSCSCSMICFTLVCRLQLQLLGCLAPWVGAQAHVHEPTCFASASSRLADEAALHLMLNCKGSSGVKCCSLCTNVFNGSLAGKRRPLERAPLWATDHYECSKDRLVPMDRDTMRSILDRLETAHDEGFPIGEFAELQIELGWNYDEELRARTTLLKPWQTCTYDWMHVLFVSGVRGAEHGVYTSIQPSPKAILISSPTAGVMHIQMGRTVEHWIV